MADKYDTPLSEDEEKDFQAWQKKLPAGLQSTADYDLRGAYKSGAKEAGNGHLPDTFKKPNHPTFSDESQYHGKDGNEGGKWSGDDKAGWSFSPGKTNLKNRSAADLQKYFDEVEPNSKLNLPKSAPDKRYEKKAK